MALIGIMNYCALAQAAAVVEPDTSGRAALFDADLKPTEVDKVQRLRLELVVQTHANGHGPTPPLVVEATLNFARVATKTGTAAALHFEDLSIPPPNTSHDAVEQVGDLAAGLAGTHLIAVHSLDGTVTSPKHCNSACERLVKYLAGLLTTLDGGPETAQPIYHLDAGGLMRIECSPSLRHSEVCNRTRYVPRDHANDSLGDLVSSEIAIDHNADRSIQHLALNEVFVANLHQVADTRITAETDLSLTRLPSLSSPSDGQIDWTSVTASTHRTSRLSAISEPAIEADLDKANLRAYPPAQAFALLLQPRGASDQERYRALRALIANIRQDDTQAALVGRAIRRKGPANPRVLIEALAAAGTEAAQDQLITLFNVADDIGLAALGSVSAIREPSIKMQAAIVAAEQRDELQQQALLSLGVVANRLAKSDPERSAAIVKALAARLEATESENDAVIVVSALGNAGTAACLPYLENFATSSSVQLRIAAMSAFDGLQQRSERAAQIVIEHARFDREPAVRAAAWQAITRMKPEWEIVAPACADAIKDSDSGVARSARAVCESYSASH